MKKTIYYGEQVNSWIQYYVLKIEESDYDTIKEILERSGYLVKENV